MARKNGNRRRRGRIGAANIDVVVESVEKVVTQSQFLISLSDSMMDSGEVRYGSYEIASDVVITYRGMVPTSNTNVVCMIVTANAQNVFGTATNESQPAISDYATTGGIVCQAGRTVTKRFPRQMFSRISVPHDFDLYPVLSVDEYKEDSTALQSLVSGFVTVKFTVRLLDRVPLAVGKVSDRLTATLPHAYKALMVAKARADQDSDADPSMVPDPATMV